MMDKSIPRKVITYFDSNLSKEVTGEALRVCTRLVAHDRNVREMSFEVEQRQSTRQPSSTQMQHFRDMADTQATCAMLRLLTVCSMSSVPWRVSITELLMCAPPTTTHCIGIVSSITSMLRLLHRCITSPDRWKFMIG